MFGTEPADLQLAPEQQVVVFMSRILKLEKSLRGYVTVSTITSESFLVSVATIFRAMSNYSFQAAFRSCIRVCITAPAIPTYLLRICPHVLVSVSFVLQGSLADMQ